MDFRKCFVTKSGKVFTDIEQAKQAELQDILKELDDFLIASGVLSQDAATANAGALRISEHCAVLILQRADQIIDVLTTTASSKPKARSINGGRKSRIPKNANVGTGAIPKEPDKK